MWRFVNTTAHQYGVCLENKANFKTIILQKNIFYSKLLLQKMGLKLKLPYMKIPQYPNNMQTNMLHPHETLKKPSTTTDQNC